MSNGGLFWDQSWGTIDPDRIARYASGFDMAEDPIIAELKSRHARTVCDAGCGCGVYSLKLLAHGFEVSGFDVSAHAVRVADKLLEGASRRAKLKAASILATGYADGQFDAVVSRDVIDHMSKADGKQAICELYRITRPGGEIIITLDYPDSEYEEEPHIVNDDGDFVFTDGKWKGMVFHPYSKQEILSMIPSGAAVGIEDSQEEIVVRLMKS